MVHVAGSLSMKTGVSPFVDDRIDARRKSRSRAKDFFSRLQIEMANRQVHGGRSARNGERMLHSDLRGELGFKQIKMRTDRHHPVRCECFLDELLFLAAHMGCGKIECARVRPARRRIADARESLSPSVAPSASSGFCPDCRRQ